MSEMNEKTRTERKRNRYRRIVAEHPLYPVWVGVLHRSGHRKNCNPKDRGLYSAQKTPVDSSWLSFDVFERWALGHGWRTGLQLDRIDGSKGYGPDNCRFVTPKQNRRNASNIFKVEIDGKSVPLAEVYESHGCRLSYYTVKSRVKMGWELYKALSAPARPLHRRNGRSDD